MFSGRIWIDLAENGYGTVRAQFVEAVKERFDADGIDMPYPNTDLSGGVEVTDAGDGGRGRHSSPVRSVSSQSRSSSAVAQSRDPTESPFWRMNGPAASVRSVIEVARMM